MAPWPSVPVIPVLDRNGASPRAHPWGKHAVASDMTAPFQTRTRIKKSILAYGRKSVNAKAGHPATSPTKNALASVAEQRSLLVSFLMTKNRSVRSVAPVFPGNSRTPGDEANSTPPRGDHFWGAALRYSIVGRKRLLVRQNSDYGYLNFISAHVKAGPDDSTKNIGGGSCFQSMRFPRVPRLTSDSRVSLLQCSSIPTARTTKRTDVLSLGRLP